MTRFVALAGSALLSFSLLPCSAALATTAPSRAAASTTSVAIVGSGYTVTADHAKWRLTISAASSTEDAITVALTHAASARQGEEHQWAISELPTSSITSLGPGRWRIKPPASTVSPVLKALNLVFTGTHYTTTSCAAGSFRDYTGKLTGALLLNTGFASVGTVGSNTISFSGPSTAAQDLACSATKAPCAKGTVWGISSITHGSALATGDTQAGTDAIFLTKSTALAAPPHAGRNDSVFGQGPPASLSGGTLKITTSPGSLVTGSATMTVTAALPTQTAACYLNGSPRTESTATSVASFSGTLSARTLLTGTISTPSSGIGEVTLLSYS